MGNTESGPSETESTASEGSTVTENVEGTFDQAAGTEIGNGDRILQFKITLRGLRPHVWRRVQVPDDYDFLQLHQTLNRTMGWKEKHLYEFKAGKLVIGEEDEEDFSGFGGRPKTVSSKTVKIGKVFSPTLKKMSYLYDFGDDWYHSVVLEQILPREKGVVYPRCVTGKRACPPEDCGGTSGYEDLLTSLDDPEHKEHAENKEWLEKCGYSNFDPDRFDSTAVNKSLVTRSE